jgi:competence protein ComEC
LNYFGKLIAVSLAAQVGTLPFTLYYFNQFPGLFLLSNLVLLPGLGVLLVTGLACLTLEFLFALPQGLSSLLDGLLRMMNNYVQWAAGQEAFFFENISMTRAEFVLSTLVILLFGIYLRTGRLKILYGIAGTLLLFQCHGIINKIHNSRTDIWVIPHQTAHTMVWMRKGTHLQISCADSLKGAYLVRGVQKQWGIRSTDHIPLKREYNSEGLSLRVLDSSGLYPPDESRPDFLLLSGSPRVHLGRVLQGLKPAIVIADGSNYTSDLKRWKRSCSETGIPFHATALSGAYEIKIPSR